MNATALAQTGELAEVINNSWRDEPLRFSSLKCISQSPAHYLHARKSNYEETLAMRLGSGAHAILFGTPWVLWEGKTRNGKVWDAFEAEHEGKCILNRSEHAKATAMADAIRAHGITRQFMFNGAAFEQRIDWEWRGRKWRSTPDVAGDTFLIDLKCLRSADPEKVKWQSKQMHYNAQAALYRRALNGKGHRIKDCYLAVVESKAPHPVTLFRFTESALEAGDKSVAGWLDQLAECELANRWDGYAGGIVDLDVPVSADDLMFGEDDEET